MPSAEAERRRAPATGIWRRRALWAVACLTVVAAGVVAAHAPWSALAADAGRLDRILPHDVEIAFRLDPEAVARAPAVRSFDSHTLRAGLDTLQLGDLETMDLGDEVAWAHRDGAWVALVRVRGPADVLRIGFLRTAARLGGRLTVTSPTVEQVETADGDLLYASRWRDVQIVGDDPDLVADALDCGRGAGRSLAARSGWADALSCTEAPGACAFFWSSSGWSTELVDLLLPSLERAGDLLGVLIAPDEVGALGGTLDLRSPRGPAARVRWSYPGGLPGPLERAASRPLSDLAGLPELRAPGHEVVVRGGVTLARADVADVLDLLAADREDYEAWSGRLGGEVSFSELRPSTPAADPDRVRAALVGWRGSAATPSAQRDAAALRPLPEGLLLVRPRAVAPSVEVGAGAVDAPRHGVIGHDGFGDEAVLLAVVDFAAVARLRAVTEEQRAQRRADGILRQEERSRRRRLTVRLARQGLHGAELRTFVDEEIAGWRARAGDEALRVAAAQERGARRLLESVGRVGVALARTGGGAELRLWRAD